MKPGYSFFLNSILLGIGLAMDAFSVSCANALREPCMRRRRMCGIAGVYAFFQFLMPMAGWLCVHTIEERFSRIQWVIPWIALGLLVWIGAGMLLEGIREEKKAAAEPGSASVAKAAAEPGSASGAKAAAEPGSASGAKAAADPGSASGAKAAADSGSASGAQKTTDSGNASSALTLPVLLLQGIATSIDALSTGFTIAEYQFLMAFTACLIIAAVTFVICMGGLVIGRKAGSRLSGKAGILGGVILIAIGLEIVITHYINYNQPVTALKRLP